MAGPFSGHGIDINTPIEDEPLFGDPYIQLLVRHLRDPELFQEPQDRTIARQKELLLPFLDYFLRHDRDGYYQGLFRRRGLLDESGPSPQVRGDVALQDLAKLRVHSDDLRGQGQRPRLIREIDPEATGPRRGRAFTSSGTTGHAAGAVTILRSPMTIQLMRLAIPRHMAWMLGFPLHEACFLLQLAPEMTDFLAMAGFSADAFRHAGAEVLLGGRLRDDPAEPNIWRRLGPDVAVIQRFFASKAPRKCLLAGAPSLVGLASQPDLLARLNPSPPGEAPCLDLGEGGVLMTGGGLKRVPQYRSARELTTAMRTVVVARRQGERVPAPVCDVFGLTESATIFGNKVGDPAADATWIKCPHPLAYVTTLESAQRLRPVPDDEFERSRLLFYVNFSCVDYLEAVVPGDYVTRLPMPAWPQHGFVYDRRAEASEGFAIREGCG